MLAGDVQELRQSGAGADENGIVAFAAHQLVDGDGLADDDVGLELDSHAAQVIDLLPDDGLGQAKLGDAVDEHAANLVQRLKDAYLVAFLDEVSGAAQARRAAADDGDFLAGRRGDGRHPEFAACLLVVGDKALQVADGERRLAALLAEQTAAFALVFLRADAAGDGRQRVVLADFGRRAEVVSVKNEVQEFLDLDANRTG